MRTLCILRFRRCIVRFGIKHRKFSENFTFLWSLPGIISENFQCLIMNLRTCTIVIHTIFWKFPKLRLTSPSVPIIYSILKYHYSKIECIWIISLRQIAFALFLRSCCHSLRMLIWRLRIRSMDCGRPSSSLQMLGFASCRAMIERTSSAMTSSCMYIL